MVCEIKNIATSNLAATSNHVDSDGVHSYEQRTSNRERVTVRESERLLLSTA